MRALVVTIVHHPEDSRIRGRQIPALVNEGWTVTYAAPFTGYDVTREPVPGVDLLDLPRAVGRHRLSAIRAARATLRQHGPQHDVVILHDPELLLATQGIRLPPVVWDVHEDTPATVVLKPWLPRPARSVARFGARALERWADRRHHLILAEHAYQGRFRRQHVVVPNTVVVPDEVEPAGDSEVVYIGHLSHARGARDLIRLGEILRERAGGSLQLRLIGHADSDTESDLAAAASAGVLRWDGFLPVAEALGALRGALAGLSLLHDQPNYRASMPTKVIEYMAYGVPVVSTPLPLVRGLLETSGAGILVPFQDPAAAARAVLTLRDDPDTRQRMGRAGHAIAAQQYDWRPQARAFTREMMRIAQSGQRT